jgi:Ice-binding-like
MNAKQRRIVASVIFAALPLCPSSTLAAVAPSLGNAQSFAVLAATGVSNTGSSVITGDLGIAPGLAVSVTGFPPGIVIGGMIHAGAVTPDLVAAGAQLDASAAFSAIDQPCNTTYPPGNKDLGGLTLTPGVYCSMSSFSLTGTLTLNAGGNPDAVWIFKMPASTLTTATDSVVRVINGGQNCNVFWRVGSSATLGTRTTFIGTIIANTTITLDMGASVSGRALALNGALTLDTNNLFATVCSGVPPSVAPTLGKAFDPATINAGAGNVSTLTITLSNPNTSVATLSTALIDTLPPGVTIAATPNGSTTCSGTGAVAAVAGGSTVTLPTTRSIPAGGGILPGICTVTVDVTAPAAGSYLNALVAGALQTSNGNNAVPAIATLTVVPLVPPGGPPALGKAFSPASINAGAGNVSTLTITLSNPNASVATLNAPLIDTLPLGVTIAAAPNASTTCPGVSCTAGATAGGTTVTLPATTCSIPASSGGLAGRCTIMVDVTAPAAGFYFNTLITGALQTTNGNNGAPVVTTLIVNPLLPPGPPVPAPALSGWGTFLLTAALLALVAFVAMRRLAL